MTNSDPGTLRPTALSPRFEGIPAELKVIPNWVLWRYLPPEKPGGKWRKVPYQPNGIEAKTNERSTWSSFETCCAVYQQGGYDGIGFCFDDEAVDSDGLCAVGIDLDKCIADKSVQSLARERIKRLDTYTELSPSGTGFHLIARAKPLDRQVKSDGVEIYCRGRYFTFTGLSLKQRQQIRAADVEVRALIAEVQAKQAASSQSQPKSSNGANDWIKNLRGQPVPECMRHLDPNRTLGEGIKGYWYNLLQPEQMDEVVDHALKVIIAFLEETGGHTDDLWFRLTTAVARSGAPHAEDIFVKHARSTKSPEPEDFLRNHFARCQKDPRGITVGTLLKLAKEHGADFGKWRQREQETDTRSGEVTESGVKLRDFYAYMPLHNYIFAPSREPWPASSVNARIPPVVTGTDDEGEEITLKASLWIDNHQPVEMMTWAPGMPMIIANRLIAEGGWIDRQGVSCFNLYRPPTIRPGDASKAGPWIDLVRKVYPNDADHIIKWFAQRKQHPEVKINHGLFLGSQEHGIGKDTILEGPRRAVGDWNFKEVAPKNMFDAFNPWRRAVILRVSEVKDMGDVSRFELYDGMKTLLATPPGVLECNEKYIKQHYITNCVGVVITSNHLTDGIYLPAEDRRHYVAWSDCKPADFSPGYWPGMWDWYNEGGDRHVAAYLASLDIADFDPKAAPPKTPAFWSIVNANRTSEEGELQDLLDQLGNPDAVTISQITDKTPYSTVKDSLRSWLEERKNRKAVNHRLEKCGYRAIANPVATDGHWRIDERRQMVYAKISLSLGAQLKAAEALQREAAERKTAQEESGRRAKKRKQEFKENTEKED